MFFISIFTFYTTPMLFDPFNVRSLQLKNRIVMAPMARCRAVDSNTPNSLMAEYYGQRASAGMIITEGTSPSPNGLGYARMPGLFNKAQQNGWRHVTETVHAQGGRIILQLMHAGRVAHLANLPTGAEVLGPMDQVCPGEMYTDLMGMQPHSPARAMTEADIETTVGEFAQAARMAVDAGFDGVEIHAANGYLIEQFLNANVNKRTDGYGSGISGRNRFALEVVRETVMAIGARRVGIRLSPHGALNDMGSFSGLDDQFIALMRELSRWGLMYVHVLDHSALLGGSPVPDKLKRALRNSFQGPLILAGGFDQAGAQRALTEDRADLIAFARPFLANPDLVERMKANAPLNVPDMNTFYTPGAEGYTDYPTLDAQRGL